MSPVRMSLAAGLALLAAQPSAAQVSSLKGHDSNAPVDVNADRLEVQDRADRAVFSGNVVVTQADMTLTAPRLTAVYSNNGGIEIQRLDATGGVTVKSPTETATGQYAIYDLDKRLITMIGAVTLTRGANKLQGGRLVINLDTGRAMMDGSAVGAPAGTAANPGGRVSGRFTVPQRAGNSR